MNEVEKFLTFLLEKLYVFDKNAKSEIRNIQEMQRVILTDSYINKKLKDLDYVIITKELITKFKCYNILDLDYEVQLTGHEVSVLCNQYKMYKQSTKVKEETYPIIKKNDMLDTSDTQYIYSLDDIKTKMLINKFGELNKIGGENDKYRYEYKFELVYNGKTYSYSLYDYLNTQSQFYVEEDIYWHVSSNTTDIKINNLFKKMLINLLFC